jgi:hypothetical protein
MLELAKFSVWGDKLPIREGLGYMALMPNEVIISWCEVQQKGVSEVT